MGQGPVGGDVRPEGGALGRSQASWAGSGDALQGHALRSTRWSGGGRCGQRAGKREAEEVEAPWQGNGSDGGTWGCRRQGWGPGGGIGREQARAAEEGDGLAVGVHDVRCCLQNDDRGIQRRKRGSEEEGDGEGNGRGVMGPAWGCRQRRGRSSEA